MITVVVDVIVIVAGASSAAAANAAAAAARAPTPPDRYRSRPPAGYWSDARETQPPPHPGVDDLARELSRDAV